MTEPVSVPQIRVFLVDDHSVFRSGVKAELAAVPAINIVGDAGTVSDAVAGIRDARPDVVLLDVHMPDGGGLAVIQAVLGQSHPIEAPKFLALSVSDAAEDVIALIRAGARGYVTKSIDGAELAEAIACIHGGDAYFSPRLAGFVLDAFASGGVAEDPAGEPEPVSDDDPAIDVLTRRELEVLRLLARGYTYKEIAEQLFISVKTVETHASNILRKTQTSNRHQLTRWAADHSLD
ncbi:response regulator transcription factor [Corynebacterium aquatimens]|uniref:DNA-binding NarL/FixJ family response regulator n=1 Tax=Corynebacterium aquatimens TaxID=1190508 RepID=A0A931E1M3_9CORY|nr:response regulator transcription factor [Corynebacterium aquatimens]MBG6123079.1 DNA-binding NarL/FixJ family response regulator [Corynebacterium aquatimens]WJY66587.1 Transcriptional regulatory protein DegU [Corynebacterium aquatimens]